MEDSSLFEKALDKPQGKYLGSSRRENREKGKILAQPQVGSFRGWHLVDPAQLQEVVKSFIYEQICYVFHAFKTRLIEETLITLEPDAHTEAKWLMY